MARALLIVTLLLIAISARAAEEVDTPCRPYPSDKRFRWTLRGEVAIPDLIGALATIGCQRILLPQSVAQRASKVSLQVPDLLSAEEAWRIFHAALESSGLTVEKSGKLWKIVETLRGKEISRILSARDDTPDGETIVTRLIRPQHARPSEISDVLGKLKGKDGDVSLLTSSASIVITDRATTVRRMEALAAALDAPRPPSEDVTFIIPTRHQAPTELAIALEKILAGGRAPDAADAKSPPAQGPLASGITALIPVDGARLLVVLGTDTGFRRALALVDRLDPEGSDDASGRAHVIYLMHTNAEEMATAISTIGIAGRSPAPASGKGGGGASGELKIGADKIANALLVYANATDFEMVRSLVTRLDVPRRQVFVEAVVLDLSVDKSRDLGLSFHQGGALGGGATGLVGSGSSSVNSVIAGADAKSLAGLIASGGLLGGVMGPAFNVAGMSVPSFGVVVRALEREKDVNVISRPHLITTDNVKATLSVGQKIPFQVAQTAVAGQAMNSFQRMDVALKLELTPHLNESDLVRLEIDGEIADVPDGQSAAAVGGPTTNNRVIKTTVTVRDGEPIVLGGLQKETESESVEKIPGLGSIPVLGRLFQTRSKQRTKQDLLVILTPYVIRGPEDFRRIYERKLDERRELVERFTSFKDTALYEPRPDYARKRGLLEEINVTAKLAEVEAESRRRAEDSLRRRQIAGPLTSTAPRP